LPRSLVPGYRFGMAAVVYLTTRAPSKLAQDLLLAGHKVFEAVAVSEALYLCECQSVDVIVIAPEVEEPDVVKAQMRHITIQLKPEATAQELIWELSNLFPSGTAATIQ
jgi:hypothetical protein